ncbi:MAG: radical SAM protein [Planctomycetaceae bacterium]|jgi:radical SAM protein with 4Fe4S-binding SPASM domain|nr:radical SAM protein [Planctomycetaceae bacterium]
MYNWEEFITLVEDSTTKKELYSLFFADESVRQHEIFNLPDDVVLAIPENSCLRKDSTQVIYYGNSRFDVWCCRLLPQQVVCLSLFDGIRTLYEVAEVFKFLSGCNHTAADLKVRYFLRTIDALETEKLVNLSKNPTARIQTINAKDFLIKNSKLCYRLDAPTSLIIMPTDKCLTDCEYCYACRRTIHEKNLLSVKRILELVDEAHEIGVIGINVDGGDIFARKEYQEILERMLAYKIEPSISTKGYVSKEKSKELARIGLRWLQVGLDSTREMCDKLVRRRGYFDRIVETIYNLNDVGVRVRTNSIITRESLHLLPELVDFLMTLPLTDIKVAPAFLGLFRGNESMLLTTLQKQWFRRIMEEKEKQYPDHKINWECEEDILDAPVEQIAERFSSRPYCSSGRTQIVITPDGKVVTCEQSPQEGEFVCGDVTYQSIMEVWNSEALKKWYEPSKELFIGTVCYDCDVFTDCVCAMGHCWLQVLKIRGRLYDAHPYCPKGKKPKQHWN